MEYLVFPAGAVILGLFTFWCIADSALDARRARRDAEATTVDEVVSTTSH
jgi:hypothetical protein